MWYALTIVFRTGKQKIKPDKNKVDYSLEERMGCMKLDFDVYQKRFLELTKEWKFSRLGRNFETSSHKYFYDTGTGKVFQISEELNEVLSNLSKPTVLIVYLNLR